MKILIDQNICEFSFTRLQTNEVCNFLNYFFNTLLRYEEH